jgi:hypothetical protein
MYNLLISIGIGLVAFVITGLIGGNWVAGLIPATLALGIAYFLLARRTGQQLQAVMERAGAEFAKLESIQPPRTPREAQKLQALQQATLARGREIIHEGFALAKWQFLVKEQIHAQLGALEYMQQNWDKAREHLEQAWGRHWQAQGMLACMDLRDKKIDEALERMGKASGVGGGGGDALFWGLYTWIAYKGGQRDKALEVATQGLSKHEGSEPLKQMKNAIANKKPVRPDGFAPGWFQFFPEQAPQAQAAMKNAQKHGQQPNVKRGGYSFPHPRR